MSDINRADPIIHALKRTNLSEAVFLAISFNITTTLTFLANFKDMIVLYNY